MRHRFHLLLSLALLTLLLTACAAPADLLTIRPAEAYLRQARQHFAAGGGKEPLAAVKRIHAECDQAITYDANSAAAYNCRAAAAILTGLFEGKDRQWAEEAAQDLATALTLDPTSADAYHNRGVLAYLRAMPEPMGAGTLNYQDAADPSAATRNRATLAPALADYNQALTLDPTSAATVYNRALVYFFQDMDAAAHDLDQVIALAPSFAPAYPLRAWSFFVRADQAASDLTTEEQLQADADLQRWGELMPELAKTSQSQDPGILIPLLLLSPQLRVFGAPLYPLSFYIYVE